jgi:hypothetical protein
VGSTFSLQLGGIGSGAADTITTASGWFVKEDGRHGTISLVSPVAMSAASPLAVDLTLTYNDGTTENVTLTTANNVGAFTTGNLNGATYTWENVRVNAATTSTDLFSLEVGDAVYNLSTRAVAGQTLNLVDYSQYDFGNPTKDLAA